MATSIPRSNRRQFLALSAMSLAGAAAAGCIRAAVSATSDSVALQRDKSGRLLAPVTLNGEGPFLFVVDTAASRCALSLGVLKQLRLRPERAGELIVNGTSGRSVVSTVHIDELEIGAFRLVDRVLPVLTPDALGGAEGVLGADCLSDRKLELDFAGRRLAVVDSLGPVMDSDTHAVEMNQQFGGLVCVDVSAGAVSARAILDSGSLHTRGNPELHKRLSAQRQGVPSQPTPSQIASPATRSSTATTRGTVAEATLSTPISIAGLLLAEANVLYSDHRIFKTWSFQTIPALVLGLDVLGRARYLAIDYRRSELHVRM